MCLRHPQRATAHAEHLLGLMRDGSMGARPDALTYVYAVDACGKVKQSDEEV
jgi:hypothetical protein